MNFVSVCLCSC